MNKNKLIAGVDEVGRGSWIGPVFSAAVILKKNINKNLLKDSKKIPSEERKKLANYIKKNSIYSVGKASIKEIDKLNILQATLLSMKRAINNLKHKPNIILVDGVHAPKNTSYHFKTIIRGDEKIPAISAASIIAKVARDRYITRLAKNYISYGWHTNFGYGTKKHLGAIYKFGVTNHHRKSFKPMHNILLGKKK
ncbi:MAG: ribonuclease HII [Candidatus Pelagibacter sp.]|mgnify:FL=1|nr:ribonuclease HII [Candidatus Pelagibacter sp.]MDP6440118.1 ribonuclease HII [Pelagibacteraceae bacterium]